MAESTYTTFCPRCEKSLPPRTFRFTEKDIMMKLRIHGRKIAMYIVTKMLVEWKLIQTVTVLVTQTSLQ